MNIPMPRAKIGDCIVWINISTEKIVVGTVLASYWISDYNPGWCFVADNLDLKKEGFAQSVLEHHILMNLTTGIDYQEKEEAVKCFHPVTIEYEGKRRCQTCLEEMFYLLTLLTNG